MKLRHLSLIAATLAFAPHSHAEGWLDSIKNTLGMEEQTETQKKMETAAPNVSDMVSSVSDKLGVTNSQATGGLASIFNYAKGNLSADKFGGLSESLPGLGALLNAVPSIGNDTGEGGGLGGLMDKAANYSDSLKTVNAVKKQFEALGLKPEMVMQFINATKAYLDTEQGQQIKATLMQGLSGLKF